MQCRSGGQPEKTREMMVKLLLDGVSRWQKPHTHLHQFLCSDPDSGIL